jgi:hypothetical protein
VPQNIAQNLFLLNSSRRDLLTAPVQELVQEPVRLRALAQVQPLPAQLALARPLRVPPQLLFRR